MPQGKVFEGEGSVRPHGSAEGTEQAANDVEHAGHSPPAECVMFNGYAADEFLVATPAPPRSRGACLWRNRAGAADTVVAT